MLKEKQKRQFEREMKIFLIDLDYTLENIARKLGLEIQNGSIGESLVDSDKLTLDFWQELTFGKKNAKKNS